MINRTQRGAAALLSGVFVTALIGISAFTTATPAQAFPKFARKENKPCSYCHVKPSGGGPRNPNGIWYDKHANSFGADFTEAKAEEMYGKGKPAETPAPTATPSPTPTAKPTPKPTPKATPKPVAKKPVVKKPVKKVVKKPTKKATPAPAKTP